MGNLTGIDWSDVSPVVLIIDDEEDEGEDNDCGDDFWEVFELISRDLKRSSPKIWLHSFELTGVRIGT